jgi:hypothetical protein
MARAAGAVFASKSCPWGPVHRWASRLQLACLLAVSSAGGPVLAQALPAECGSLATHYGPFDYTVDRAKLPVVEAYHFTTTVEHLIRGVSGSIGGELSYTLKAFPNHHRALVSASRYAERLKTDQPTGLEYSVTCFYLRALTFRPKDLVVRMLYAQYLVKGGQRAEALAQLEVVRAAETDNPLTHYNLGLLYAEMGELELALAQAHKALALGVPGGELVRQLTAKGAWREAPAEAAAPAASAASR